MTQQQVCALLFTPEKTHPGGNEKAPFSFREPQLSKVDNLKISQTRIWSCFNTNLDSTGMR